MRAALIVATILLGVCSAGAAEIREFDIPTVERLGRDLARASQKPDRGASTPVRKRARETGIAAVQGKLFDARYEYVVVNDPDGGGFLVYALPTARGKITMGGEFRVTVSGDGSEAERVDALARSLLPAPTPPRGAEREKPAFVSMSQVVSSKPLETSVYISLRHKVPASVGTMDGKIWAFINGKVYELTPELMKQLEERGGNEAAKR